MMVVSNKWIRQHCGIEGHYRTVTHGDIGVVVHHSRKLPQCYTTERMIDLIVPISTRRRRIVRLLSTVQYHRNDTDRRYPMDVTVGRIDSSGFIVHDGSVLFRRDRWWYYSGYTLIDGVLDIYSEMVLINILGDVEMRHSTHHRVELYLSMDGCNGEIVRNDDVIIEYESGDEGRVVLTVLPVCKDGYLLNAQGNIVHPDELVIRTDSHPELCTNLNYLVSNDHRGIDHG